MRLTTKEIRLLQGELTGPQLHDLYELCDEYEEHVRSDNDCDTNPTESYALTGIPVTAFAR